MRSQAQAPAPRPDARATVINMRLRTRCRMRIQSLLGPEYSTPERIHPGPWPASGQPQRPRRKRQAGGATTHGMNACPNMRARIHAVRTGIPRPQGPGELHSPWLGNKSLRTRDHRPVHRWRWNYLRNDGREPVWQREIRTLSESDEHRRASNVQDVRLSARGNK